MVSCFALAAVLYNPLGSIPFAIIDFIVMLISGAVIYLLMHLLNKKKVVVDS